MDEKKSPPTLQAAGFEVEVCQACSQAPPVGVVRLELHLPMCQRCGMATATRFYEVAVGPSAPLPRLAARILAGEGLDLASARAAALHMVKSAKNSKPEGGDAA